MAALCVSMLLVIGGSALSQTPLPAGNPTAARQLEDRAQQEAASGKHRDALVTLDGADAGYRRLRDAAGMARVALKRSDAYRALGERDTAERYSRQARDLARDPTLKVSALTQLARLADDRGDPAGAVVHLKEALPLADATGDTLTRARVLYALGRNAIARTASHEALDYTTRAMEVADRLGDLELRQMTRGSRSTAYIALSRYDEALADAQAAYDLARNAADPRVRAGAAFSLAQVHNLIWNLDRVIALWTEAIDLYRRAGYSYGEAVAVRQRFYAWYSLGDLDRAVEDGHAAIPLAEKAGTPWIAAEIRALLALLEARRGRRAEATQFADLARAALPSTPAMRHLFIERDLAFAALEMEHPAGARGHFERTLQLARERGDRDNEWTARYGLGRVALASADPDAAMPHLEAAIASIERLRQALPEAGLRAAFMTNRISPYEALVEALFAKSSAPDDEAARRALGIAERARSRALIDLLAESRSRATDPRLKAIEEQEIAIGQRLSDAQRRVLQASESDRAKRLAELDALEVEYESLIVRVRRDNPAYAALAFPQSLSADAIARLLQPDEALVEFLLTRKGGFAWLVRGGRIRAYRVPSAETLDGDVRLLQALVRRRDDEGVRTLGRGLFERLIGPVSRELAGARRLLIVADGPLHRLPFALLRSNGGWLLQSHAIATVPSATVLDYLRRSPRDTGRMPLLALAGPGAGSPNRPARMFDGRDLSSVPLPYAVDEARTIARVVGAGESAVRTGAAAAESAVKRPDSRRFRVLHFAAHAIVDEVVARRSAVLLAPGDGDDGLLQINEIANLTLDADLVVLAACRSQMGRSLRGEGLLSLSRAFMHAGSRGVVASLWNVGDRETGLLMNAFYAALAGGLPPDHALRLAQLQMIRAGGRYAQPAAWAPFIVTGDARLPVFTARPLSPRLTALGIFLAALGLVLIFRKR